MTTPNLDRLYETGNLSMIGGAAQCGSAKPEKEREAEDRKNEQRQDESPASSGGAARQDSVGGISNDKRSDEERASGGRNG